MGETASPGSDVTAEIDHIAISVFRDMLPLPVEIFIVRVFLPFTLQPMCQYLQAYVSRAARKENYVVYAALRYISVCDNGRNIYAILWQLLIVTHGVAVYI